MLTHFSYRKYRDNPRLQIENAIENIFKKNRLIYSKNPEFIPRINPMFHPRFSRNSIYNIQYKYVKKNSNFTEIGITNPTHFPDYPFSFMREDVPMICFINIEVDELVSTTHTQRYGKLGLVFMDEFLCRNDIKNVRYYSETELLYDVDVLKWNLDFAYRSDLTEEDCQMMRQLEIDILAYRKPSLMFKTFQELRRINLIKGQIEDVYNEYKIGYNFQNENEWRIVSFQNEYLYFKENELSFVLVPNYDILDTLRKYFESNWKIVPEIKICP